MFHPSSHISPSQAPLERGNWKGLSELKTRRETPNPVQQKSRPIEPTSCSNMSEDVEEPVLTDVIENENEGQWFKK